MHAASKTIFSTFLIILVALIVPTERVLASSDYVVIQSGTVAVGDNSGRNRVRTLSFTLPSNVLRSGSAVLEYRVKETQDNFNEIYINPVETCLENDIGVIVDGVNSRSIGFIEDYDADEDMLDDYFAEHKTFPSSKLKADRNILMICARGSSGGLSDVDDFFIRDIVLHYKTTSLPVAQDFQNLQ